MYNKFCKVPFQFSYLFIVTSLGIPFSFSQNSLKFWQKERIVGDSEQDYFPLTYLPPDHKGKYFFQLKKYILFLWHNPITDSSDEQFTNTSHPRAFLMLNFSLEIRRPMKRNRQVNLQSTFFHKICNTNAVEPNRYLDKNFVLITTLKAKLCKF